MISIIIPTLNEERALPATLDCLLPQAGGHEIILVDGGSIDRTINIVRSYPEVTVISAEQGRAGQMNAGAACARGEWLLFLHADTCLPDDGLARIAALPGQVQAGGFKHRFSGRTPGLRFISWLHNFRCRCTRVFYGDQAMFIRRDLFSSLGGFPLQQMEDLLLGETLVKHTRPRILDAHVTTSSRKFEKSGTWTGLGQVLLILTCHTLKLPVTAQKFFANVR